MLRICSVLGTTPCTTSPDEQFWEQPPDASRAKTRRVCRSNNQVLRGISGGREQGPQRCHPERSEGSASASASEQIPRRNAPRDDSLAFRPRRIRPCPRSSNCKSAPTRSLRRSSRGPSPPSRNSTKNQESSPGSLRAGSSEPRSDPFNQLHPLHPYSLRLWG